MASPSTSPEIEQFTLQLLLEAGVSVSDRYLNELNAEVERRIALAIIERVDSRTALDLERSLVYKDPLTIQSIIARIPGIQDVIKRELDGFRTEYLHALHA